METLPRSTWRLGLWCALGLVVAALAPACGRGSGNSPPPAPPDAQVRRLELENGLRAVVVPDRLAPVVGVVVNYRVGSDEAPPGFPGTAHAVEHMMFRGSPGLDAEQLADIGAALGGAFNADTQGAVTQYFFLVPAADLDVVLRIEALRMGGLTIGPEAWHRERGAIEQEVSRDLSDPEFVLHTRLLEALFRGTPYAHDALGTRASFDATSAAMLRDFYTSWYAPNNAVLVLSGDVDPTWVETRLSERFGSLKARTLPERPDIELGPIEAQTLRMPTDQPVGLAALAFRMPGYADDGYPATRVLVDALDGSRGPLRALVDSGQALDAGFDLEALPRAGMGIAWVSFPAGSDGEEALRRLRGVLAGARREGVPAELVVAAQRRARTQAELRKNSVLGLAMAWSEALVVEGRDSPDAVLAVLEGVRPVEVDRAAATTLGPSTSVAAILTPRPSSTASAQTRAAARVAPAEESPGPRPSPRVALPRWAEEALGRLEVPHSSVHPVMSHLANGLGLIVVPDGTSDVVGVYGHIRNQPDLQTPPGLEGVDRVLDELLDAGTERLSRDAFRKAVDDLGAELVPGTDFSLEVLDSVLDRGLALLADVERRPRLPEEAFEIARRRVAEVVRGERASPDYRAARALRAGLLPEGDPGLRQATPESVDRLSREDVVAYHQAVFRPDMTTVVVIGRIDPGPARELVEAHFGDWSAQGPRPDVDLPAIPPNPSGEVRVANPERVQDEVTLAQILAPTRSNPDYYPLELGSQILGGGFYASRLYRELRAERGLVYHVDVSLDAGRTRSRYAVHFGCDPAEVDPVQERVVRALQNLQQEAPSSDELRRAKALLLRRIVLAEASVPAVAQGLLQRTDLGLPLDEPTEAGRRYVALSGEAVRDAFARWVRPNGLFRLVEGPPP